MPMARLVKEANKSPSQVGVWGVQWGMGSGGVDWFRLFWSTWFRFITSDSVPFLTQVLADLAQLAASHAIHFELARGRALAWRVLDAPEVWKRV